MTQLYINGKFATSAGFAQAVVVEDSRFVFIGSSEDARLHHHDGPITDLAGKLVVPGFNDSHMHLFGMAATMERLNLGDIHSIAELQARLCADLVSEDFHGKYLSGRGFNQNEFVEQRFPTKADLDAVSNTIPIIVTRVCGHIAVANSVALAKSGIDEFTQIAGGDIDFATGLVTEKALGLLFTSHLKTTKADVKRLLIKGMKQANSLGVTTVQTDDLMHGFGDDFAKMIAVYDELDRSGQLSVRIRAQSQLPTLALLQKYIEKGFANREYSSYLKMGPLKLLLDGSLGARTAALSQPYHDDPSTSGILTYPDEELYELVKTAHLCGMSVAMHAIGDLAMTQALNVYERVLREFPRKDHRHTLIHCQITTPKILQRMKDLQVLAAVQPIFIEADLKIVESRVGKTLASTSYAFHTMQTMGIPVAIGTDSPVESVNPFENLQSAITRCDKSGRCYNERERMSVQTAIDAYTKASAFQTRDEAFLGEIKVGYLADFVVLDRDLFTIKPEEIGLVRPIFTVIGGRKISIHELN